MMWGIRRRVEICTATNHIHLFHTVSFTGYTKVRIMRKRSAQRLLKSLAGGRAVSFSSSIPAGALLICLELQMRDGFRV